jgi:hypothetical protein
VGSAAAVAAGLLAGGAIAATASGAATTGEHRPPPIGAPPAPDGPMGLQDGEVTAVSESSITVASPDGSSHRFMVTGATVVEEGHSPATKGDLAIGERVTVRPTAPSSSVLAEVDIVIPRLAGKVVSTGKSSFTIEDPDGFYRTIVVTAATTYKQGSSSATFEDVTAGQFVMAEGSVDSDHTSLDARIVQIGQLRSPAPGVGFAPMPDER